MTKAASQKAFRTNVMCYYQQWTSTYWKTPDSWANSVFPFRSQRNWPLFDIASIRNSNGNASKRRAGTFCNSSMYSTPRVTLSDEAPSLNIAVIICVWIAVKLVASSLFSFLFSLASADSNHLNVCARWFRPIEPSRNELNCRRIYHFCLFLFIK